MMIRLLNINIVPNITLLKVGSLILLLLSISTRVDANRDNSDEKVKVAVVARATSTQEIMIRWGVTTSEGWRKGNKYGYEVTRYTISRHGNLLEKPEKRVLGQISPEPLEKWMPIIESNDNAAIVAQALYGEGFDVEGLDDISAIINRSKEQEQRFTWALYAADQDYDVAKMAGLALTDSSVELSEKYLYKVSIIDPEERNLIEEGSVFIGASEYSKLPKPVEFVAIPMDAKALLSWDSKSYKSLYGSYFIERSLDSIEFTRINRAPISQSYSDNNKGKEPNSIFYFDSIANNTTYYYRVIGKSIFNEFSPPSDIISVSCQEALTYTPHITNKDYKSDKNLVLEWEFPEDGNSQISGFTLDRSDKVDGIYSSVVSGITPEARSVEYNDMQAVNYLTITAIGKDGTTKASLPALIQPVDSIPPAIPTELKGEVDSLGVVTLTWKANEESDMQGYRLFRGNNRGDEFSAIVVSPHNTNIYYDTISIENLNSKVFYTISAVDRRNNTSEMSEVLELKKPDVIPPTEPVIKDYKIDDRGVEITWINSSSEDIAAHTVYRKGDGEAAEWQEQYKALYNDSITSIWIDSEAEQGERYSYRVIAVDDSNLESEPSREITVRVPKTDLKPKIENLRSYVDREHGYIELYWEKYEEKNVSTIMIYKGAKDKPVTLFREVLPTVERIVDNKVKPSNEYKYIIRAMFKSGMVSEVTILDVQY